MYNSAIEFALEAVSLSESVVELSIRVGTCCLTHSIQSFHSFSPNWSSKALLDIHLQGAVDFQARITSQ